MSSASPFCPACQSEVRPVLWNLPEVEPCPNCQQRIQVLAFPALYRKNAVSRVGENVGGLDEATCFFHPTKRAHVPCDQCGRFLCHLCEIDFNGMHLCPSCLEAGKSKGKILNLKDQHTRWDLATLGWATVPLIIPISTIVTAPATIYFFFRHRKDPPGLTQKGQRWFIVAIIVATLELAGWGVMIFAITSR